MFGYIFFFSKMDYLNVVTDFRASEVDSCVMLHVITKFLRHAVNAELQVILKSVPSPATQEHWSGLCVIFLPVRLLVPLISQSLCESYFFIGCFVRVFTSWC